MIWKAGFVVVERRPGVKMKNGGLVSKFDVFRWSGLSYGICASRYYFHSYPIGNRPVSTLHVIDAVVIRNGGHKFL